MRLTILGMGNMGQALAARALDQGHETTVWNRTPGRDGDLVARGAASVGSVPGAVERAEVVLVVLADDAAVRGVCLGTSTGQGLTAGEGALAVMGPDTVLCNVSTVSPVTARELAGAGPAGRVLDTPVMGSPDALAAGRGAFLVGGPAATAARLEPLWHDLGAGATYCGPAGSGAVMKVLSNLLLMTGVTALAEAIAAARAGGIPDELVRSVFSSSPVVSAAGRIRLDSLLDPRHPGWFSPALAVKDVRLAAATAAAGGVPCPLADATIRQLDEVIAQGRRWEDVTAVIEAYAQGPDRS